MRHYEITVNNGPYPLTYKCSTISEAFGCLIEASSWASHIHFDPDRLMETLVSMMQGKTQTFEARGYRLAVLKGEV